METSACIVPEGSKDRDGYSLTKGKGLFQRAHRVAYCKHHKLRIRDIEGKIVRHTCDNRACINPEHLLLGTQADNVQDMISRGRFAYRKGETAPNSRLTEADVTEIRRLRKEVKLSVIAIAKRFQLTRGYVYQILNRITWTHIP